MTAPWATVTGTRGKRVTVRCPYCGAEHTHAVEHLGRTERYAPGCGIDRSPDDRLTGYRFTTVAPQRGRSGDQVPRALRLVPEPMRRP